MFNALEKEMATHSSTWRIPGTGEPGGLPSVGLHRVGHDWSDTAAAATSLLSPPYRIPVNSVCLYYYLYYTKKKSKVIWLYQNKFLNIIPITYAKGQKIKVLGPNSVCSLLFYMALEIWMIFTFSRDYFFKTLCSDRFYVTHKN